MSGGFFRGTSADQDTRFSNKQAKLLKSQKFHPELEHLVDITKVKMDVMKPWIAKRVTELLGFEDEVLINFIYGLLDGKEVNGKEIQISLTGFMEKNTGKFMKELWQLLISAQNNASGVPQQFLDAKEEETRIKQVESDRIKGEMQKKKEKEDSEMEEEKKKKLDGGSGMTEPRSKRQLDASDDKEISTRNGARGRSRISKSPRSPGDASLSPRNRRSRSMSKSFSNSRSYSEERRKSRSPPPRGHSISSERAHRSRPRSISPRRKYSPPISLSPPIRRSPHLRRRSPSPSSPIRRRMRSPIKYRSRSPIHRRSRTPVRRRSRSPPRYRSRSPVRRRYLSPPRRRSPSPVRRRYRRSPSTPPPRSQSPIRRRSPFRNRRRSPVPARYRSHSRDALSSPSPVPGDRKRSSIRQRSPVRSPRERTRAFEKFSPARHARSRSSDESSDENREGQGSAVHRPSVSLRSPQRDSRVLESIRRKSKSSSPSPHRSQTQLKLPQDSGRRSPNEDKRSRSPYKSSVMQSKERNVRDIRASPPQNPRDRNPRRDSPEPTTKKGEFDRVRDNGNQKLKPSERSTTLSKPDMHKDLEKADSKYKHPPERPVGPRSSETKNRSDDLELRKKELDSRSEKTSTKVLPPEDSDGGKVFAKYKDTQIADEKIQPYSHETKHRKQLREMDKATAEVDDKDGSGSLSSGSDDSYKRHKRKSRKHRRSGRKEMTSDDSSDSETEDRKEAKRRKKEERRSRKEERRRRREERHRRREERRAEKLKAKSNDSRAAEEAVSEQKRLEIVLREKALESLRAKKGAGH